MSKKSKKESYQHSLVVGINHEQFVPTDRRLMKPVCHQSIENGVVSGSMLLQQIDSCKINRKKKITYFVPNNISLLLSSSDRPLKEAKQLYSRYIANSEIETDFKNMTDDQQSQMNHISSIICDYLENIQTAIVFGYTALEAFVNLSIPEKYSFTTEKNNKGISETFDKKAIERWLPLKTKVKDILSEVYDTNKVTEQTWWDNFTKLESHRNEIIHQKSIHSTEFYKDYFKQSIFNVCESPLYVIEFFYDSHADNNKTNPIWPWIEGSNSLPLDTSYDSSNFEVVGNLYEGFKK